MSEKSRPPKKKGGGKDPLNRINLSTTNSGVTKAAFTSRNLRSQAKKLKTDIDDEQFTAPSEIPVNIIETPVDIVVPAKPLSIITKTNTANTINTEANLTTDTTNKTAPENKDPENTPITTVIPGKDDNEPAKNPSTPKESFEMEDVIANNGPTSQQKFQNSLKNSTTNNISDNHFKKIAKTTKFALFADPKDVPGTTNVQKETQTDLLYNSMDEYEGSRVIVHKIGRAHV